MFSFVCNRFRKGAMRCVGSGSDCGGRGCRCNVSYDRFYLRSKTTNFEENPL